MMMNKTIHEELFVQGNEAWEKQNYKRAFELFREAAENGDSSSQHNLGYFYDEGLYVAKDSNKALFWYKRAHSQGDGSAASNIALIYKAQKEYTKALWWFHRAVKLQDHDSYFEIAQLYEQGLGVNQSIPKAVAFYRKAAGAENVVQDTIEKSLEKLEQLRLRKI